MTDPIADLLTRIRNALRARHPQVRIPASRLKREIVRILKQESYIREYREEEGGHGGILVLDLRYDDQGRPLITGIERVSMPGRRVYCGIREIPEVLGGLGLAILSTPRGVLTGQECARRGVGGEILCKVY
ncbi:MAG: 30S ribosomal protein S8 [Acidobacteria bacterium]|nr:30S ribosomal protein S8 [Acidobacteriota bacterium]